MISQGAVLSTTRNFSPTRLSASQAAPGSSAVLPCHAESSGLPGNESREVRGSLAARINECFQVMRAPNPPVLSHAAAA